MKAIQGFTTVDVVIETQAELDVLLEALGEYAEGQRMFIPSMPKHAAALAMSSDVADDLRLKIGEAAGL